MDIGIPALDLCLYTVGYPRIRRVSAVTALGDYEVEDCALVMATDYSTHPDEMRAASRHRRVRTLS